MTDARGPTRFEGGFALGNDYFNPLPLEALGGRKYDDNGFTNDLSAWFQVERDLDALVVDARFRMITERGGLERSDEADLGLTLRHAEDFGLWRLRGEVGARLALSGALGGAQLQDAAHRVLPGRRLDGSGQGQLQNQTPEAIRAGLVLSAGVALERQLHPVLTLGADARVGAALGGTGLSSLGTSAYLKLSVPVARIVSLDAEARVALRFLHTVDHSLTINGGYVTGSPIVTPSVALGVTVSHVRLGYQLRMNEGGSGTNIGELSLGVRF